MSQELDNFPMNELEFFNKNGCNWTKKPFSFIVSQRLVENIKIHELTKYHIDKIEEMIAQDCVVY